MALQIKHRSSSQKQIRGLWLLLVCGFTSTAVAQELESLTLAPGYEVEVVYDGDALVQPGAMDIDPISGDLFIDDREGVNPDGRTGRITRINLQTGTATTLIQVANGFSLNFAKDGTLYFAVGNFLLAKWDRARNTFRKFAIIPGVRGIANLEDGRLFVGEGSYGPAGLYPDSILQVDPKTGYFQPLFLPAAASADTGRLYNALGSMSIDNEGQIYAAYKTGQTVRKNKDGSYEEFNSRRALVGGLNQTPLYQRDKLVYQYDTAGGKLFSFHGDQVQVIAYGDAIRGRFSEFSGLCSDGKNIYLCGDYQRIYRIRPSNGATVYQTQTADHGVAVLSGTILDKITNTPVAGAVVQANNLPPAISDAEGHYSLSLSKELYELKVTKQGYLESRFDVDLGGGDLNKDFMATTGLPTWIAPGLVAEVWASPDDGIVSSSDIHSDIEGNVYSMNIDAARITKHTRDPETGRQALGFEFAFGDGLAGAWSLTTDNELNVYTSNGNDGVFRLPPLPNNEAHQLTAEPGNPGVVHNQYGDQMTIANTRDVDGFGILSDGSLVLNSGSGGEPSPPCNSEGTVDTILKLEPNGTCPQILSRGVPCEGGDDVISNPDLMRVDRQDRIYFANRGGNVVRVNAQSGCVDWYLLADSDGNPAHRLGSYTAPTPDVHDNVFLRGSRFEPSANVIRLYEDGKFYELVRGTLQDYGGATFPLEHDWEMIYCDGDTLIRIYTESGASIADVVRANVIPE